MDEILDTLHAMAQLSGREFSEVAAKMMVSDLSPYPTGAVLNALAKCRAEVRGFPCLADIIARIEDGRPGVEEAWANIPKDESETVIWTTEARQAHAVAALVMDDMVAARMAFKEKYLKLVSDARANRRPVEWVPSLGHDRTQRDRVLRDAVARGLLTQDAIEGLLPGLLPTGAVRIEGKVEPTLTPLQIQEQVARIRKSLEQGGQS